MNDEDVLAYTLHNFYTMNDETLFDKYMTHRASVMTHRASVFPAQHPSPASASDVTPEHEHELNDCADYYDKLVRVAERRVAEAYRVEEELRRGLQLAMRGDPMQNAEDYLPFYRLFRLLGECNVPPPTRWRVVRSSDGVYGYVAYVSAGPNAEADTIVEARTV